MTSKPIQFAALVLAGGRSRRMGTNKALLQAQPGGPTLLETVIQKVRQAGAQDLLIISDTREPYEFLDLPVVEDAIKGAGPLGGILSGLRTSSYEQNLVVACDMPNLNPLLIQHMAALTNEYDSVVPRWVDSRGVVHVEPLHAFYSQNALPKLRAYSDTGIFALHACLHSLRVRYIEQEELIAFGNPASMFTNLNRPEDWLWFTNG